MAPLEFFDFNLILGRPNIPKYRFEEDPAALKAAVAPLNITRAMVRYTQGEESHPAAANRALSAALEDFQSFLPVWAVLPHWTGEFPPPQDLVAEMRAKRVPAAVAYPQTHGFTMRRSVVGGLLDALEEAGIILAVPQAQVPFPVAEQIAHAHAGLRLVLLEVGYRSARDLYPLMEKCSNVYVDTSTYMVHRGIEEICRLFGAERLLFGSRCPFYNPGAAVAGITYAGIDEREKRLIARGNAEALLGRGER